MKNNTKPRLGIIGAGRLGTAIARLGIKAGYEVKIANSRTPDTLKLILSVLLPGVQAGTVATVIEESDIILLAIPLNQYTSLPIKLLAGKIVIDAMNYWPPTEGAINEFEDKNVSSSEFIQSYLKDTKLVKTLNHVAYNELEEHASEPHTKRNRAIVLAGNDKAAKAVVSQFIDEIGFHPVDLGSLQEGRHFQPDTTLFNVRFNADELRELMNS